MGVRAIRGGGSPVAGAGGVADLLLVLAEEDAEEVAWNESGRSDWAEFDFVTKSIVGKWAA